jgi:hypothetical protein
MPKAQKIIAERALKIITSSNIFRSYVNAWKNPYSWLALINRTNIAWRWKYQASGTSQWGNSIRVAITPLQPANSSEPYFSSFVYILWMYLHRATPLYANTSIYTGHVHILHWIARYATYDGVCRERHSKSKVVSGTSENPVGSSPPPQRATASSLQLMRWLEPSTFKNMPCFASAYSKTKPP